MPDTAPSSSRRTTGGCQCGAVRYMFTGEADPVSLCHCRMCQKASGGPFMVFGRVPVGALVWTRGRPATFRSSSLATRGFCADCGTPLTYQFKAEAISISSGSLDDPRAFEPASALGLESALAWTARIAALPGLTTDQWLQAEQRTAIDTYQHPDHEP